jgi:hypothetical protein
VVRNTLHYLAERKYFGFAIVMINLHKAEQVKTLTRELLNIIIESLELS